MLKVIAYNFGKFFGQLPAWAKLAFFLSLFGVFYFLFFATPSNQTSSAGKFTPPTKAEEDARRRTDCLATIEQKKQQYLSLISAGKYWDASTELRPCSVVLGTTELTQLVKDAEVKSLQSDINNLKNPPGKRAAAMQQLARDYPEIGAKYESQIGKLLEEADQKAAADEKKRRKSQGVSIGMSKEDVYASSWGRPEKVNTTTTKYGTREQWVYGPGNYLYFENGKLTAIQN